jgi:cell division topological specificity factor
VRCRCSPIFRHQAKDRLGGQGAPVAHHRPRARRQPPPDFLPALQRELIEVISKYVNVGIDDIKVQLEKQDNCEILEVNITLPEQPK